ncbi:MAG: hypothetical protein K0Q55_2728 [Verrucomicrobia bacterium]|nr:hypothetical protein [Verrucomicrobiota bacterium]
MRDAAEAIVYVGKAKNLRDEAAALAREALLLRELKPRFNRAGVWPAPPRFLLWRIQNERLELRLVAAVEEGWEVHGPLKGGAAVMFASLVRVLWVMGEPGKALNEMPEGWFHGRFPEVVVLPIQTEQLLRHILCGQLSGQTRPETLTVNWQREVFLEDSDAVLKFFRPKSGA